MDKGSYDKAEILAQAREELEGVIGEAHGLGDKFRKEAAGYPSAMESHSDTNRSQQQHMELASRRAAKKLEAGLADLDLLKPGWENEVHAEVKIGSLAHLRYQNGGELSVFLVPGKAAGLITYREEEIRLLPEEAALGQAVMGKHLGDTVSFEGPRGTQKLEIIYLQ